jgi:acyl-CoA reductase-like NAD-dependent aldehyde dehydrogenase
VLKPAEKTPLTSLLLAEVIDATDWPKGGFSVLTPASPEIVGKMLASDDRLRVLSFTGSDVVGWKLKGLANKKKVLLELGGNASVVVHEDAEFDYSVNRCVTGAFAYSGQVCISVQRIFIQRSIHREWTDKFLERVRLLKIGDPTFENTDIGPMLSDKACEKIEQMVSAALQEGAQALLPLHRTPGTNLIGPLVLTGTTPGMAVRSQEAFGPVVVLEPYDEFVDAISLANEGRFGLQAGVFTQDVGRLFQAFDALEVGGVIANDVPQYRVDNMPYGGVKDSGFGREGVRYAMEEMSELRLLALNLQPSS